MKIKILGSRGSRPVSGSRFLKYGGDTACLEISSAAGDRILLDAGSGLNALELPPAASGLPAPVICLSHLHFDHVQGLPFFPPLFTSPVTIYGPELPGQPLEEALRDLFNGVFFPVRWADLPSARAHGLPPQSGFRAGSILVETIRSNHPGLALAYKLTADDATIVYTGDHEIPLDASMPEAQARHERLLEFMAGADLAIVDAHFDKNDHKAHPGWGHSDFSQWGRAFQEAGIKQGLFTHFSPDYADSHIDRLLAQTRRAWPSLTLEAARPQMVMNLAPKAAATKMTSAPAQTTPAAPSDSECAICDFFQHIGALSDTHAILDSLLSEARRQTGADAGSVYLAENGSLAFAAAQNDTLFPASAASKYAYINSQVPIDRSSIAGFVASTGASLNILDVYALDPALEYGFNRSFDDKAGYRTTSTLTVPLVNGGGRLTGVLQLINARDSGGITPFSAQSERLVGRLARMATIPLEKSFLIVNMILRMLRTSALRDPSETAQHVRRVGSVAAEIYHHWAEGRGMDPEQIRATKGKLRLAAMLHDIGKVGIPDSVLKKPGRLDDAERAIMQTHAFLGSELFAEGDSEIDKMAREIALHHHAKWNGGGYTGSSAVPSPAGEDIPIWARITAIADVYDALVSRRCYKEAWDNEEALSILRKDAGSHFDPELVDCFMEIQDVVKTIYERYS